MLIGDFYYEIPTSLPQLNATSFYFVAFCLVAVFLARPFKSIFRPYVLLIASVFFLYTFGVQNLIIISCFAVIGYICQIILSKFRNKIVLFGGIGLIVIGLFFFKYSSSLFVPIGLSFYTLKIISLIVDVYRIDVLPEYNPIYYLDYVLFFPCITAGPINKAGYFIEEIKEKKDFDYKDLSTGGIRLAIGLFEKVVFCDFVASVVSRSLENVELTGINVLLGVVLYSFQIYLDFDSYSNIALGISRMFGFKLDENFKSPYLSRTIAEFWSRWHISLSTWLKDYIYIPLGGNRKGEYRKFINVIIVFIVSAIWHGNTFNFVLWGLGHALFRIIEDIIISKTKGKINNKFITFVISIFGIAINFVLVTILWMLFKYQDLSEIGNIFGRIFAGGTFNYELIGLTINECIWLQVILGTTIVLDILRYFVDIFENIGKWIFVFRWIIYVVLILLFLVFGMYGGSFDANDFIYRWF